VLQDKRALAEVRGPTGCGRLQGGKTPTEDAQTVKGVTSIKINEKGKREKDNAKSTREQGIQRAEKAAARQKGEESYLLT
jgi:hypothetical protein